VNTSPNNIKGDGMNAQPETVAARKPLTIELTDYCDSGVQGEVSLVLDPENRRVYNSGFVGAGIDGLIYTNRGLELGPINPDTHIPSLRATLEGLLPELEILCEGYEGGRWDGSNRIGVWNWDNLSDGKWDELWDALDVLNRIPQVWCAYEWIAGNPNEFVERMCTQGGVLAVVPGMIEEAKSEAILNRDDLIEALESLCEEHGIDPNTGKPRQ